MKIKKGIELTLKVESLAFGGQGLARVNGHVVFVEGAIPGQEVIAKIIRKRKGYAEARAIEVVQESVHATDPRCPHFGECGGCRLQNLDYRAQCEFKKQQVEETLRHIGGMAESTVRETIPSPDEFYYRNKMEFSFGDRRWLSKREIAADSITKPRDFALGLHVRGRFDKIIDLDICYLQSALSVEIVNFIRSSVVEGQIRPYNTRDHSGFWRHIVIREGKNTGETMVIVVTADREEFYGVVDQLCQTLKQQFPDITTIIHSINRKKAQVAIGDEERVLIGPGKITEKIGTRLFQISPNSFFQTNTRGAELLFNKILELADFAGDETVFDLYSGAGTISLYISDRVQRVIGFELVEDTVNDARVNCGLNGVENCGFVAGDLKDSLERMREKGGIPERPHAVIIDPPRAGMHQKVVQEVLLLDPGKIVYVSCNPATFARDAKLLCEGGYELQLVQPVDMFPHTPHIELVSLFRKNI